MKTPFVNIHTHRSNNIDNESIIEIRNIDVDNVVNIDVSSFYSVGIHPWSLLDGDQKLSVKSSLTSLNNPVIIAIGETGIDRTHKDTLLQQKELFFEHIELSERCRKPLIIHAVRTYSDIISIRKATKATQKWIIHGFRGNEHSAHQLLAYGFYLSLGDVLFKDEAKSLLLLNMIPKDKLFLETDDSDRTIVEVYERVCRLISVDINDLKNVIFSNFVKIFGDI